MTGIIGVGDGLHAARHNVQKTPTPSDMDAYTLAAATAASRYGAGTKADSASQLKEGGNSDRVEEAFAKLKVVMRTEDSGVSNGLFPTKSHGQKSASEQFMDYMHLTPREKIRAGMLAELGISQEEYEAMSPEEKNEVNKKIEELMKKESQQKIAEAQSPQPELKTSPTNAVI